jgi:hypothetical protein
VFGTTASPSERFDALAIEERSDVVAAHDEALLAELVFHPSRPIEGELEVDQRGGTVPILHIPRQTDTPRRSRRGVVQLLRYLVFSSRNDVFLDRISQLHKVRAITCYTHN